MDAPAESTPAVLPRRTTALRRAAVAAAFLGLLAAVWVVFRPSFGHIPRADHWWYLHQTSGHDSFADLLTLTYSYNRTISNGDYGLFRPVLFAQFALEKALFGHDWAWWQRVGVALHVTVLALFLLLARRLLALGRAPDGTPAPLSLTLLAVALAAFFALNLSVVDMVVWSHINPYMLSLALALGVMLLVLGVLASPAPPGRTAVLRLAAAWALLVAAAFAHETGQFFAVVVGAVLALDALRRGDRRRAAVRVLAFAAVLVIYQAADRLDRHLHPDLWHDADYGPVLQRAFSWDTARNTTRYLLFTLAQPFVPAGVNWHPRPGSWNLYSRMALTEPLETWPGRLYLRPLVILSALAGLLILARSARPLAGLPADRSRRTVLLFLMLPAGLLGLHLAFTVLGRLNLRPGLTVLMTSSYYAYLPLLMMLLALFALWATAPRGRWAGRLDLALVAVLLGLAWAGGARTHRLNVTIRAEARFTRLTNKVLLDLVRAHGREPGFGFRIEPDLLARVERFRDKPFPVILYPEHVRDEAPTHLVLLENGKPRAVAAAGVAAASLPARVAAVP